MSGAREPEQGDEREEGVDGLARTEEEVRALCDIVRQTAYDIHVYLGHGYLEKVYENALAHRLRKAGLNVRTQVPIRVHDEDGTTIGEYVADLLVEGYLIVELKCVEALGLPQVAQLLGYLNGARMEHGMLINFGSFKFGVGKFARSKALAQERREWLARQNDLDSTDGGGVRNREPRAPRRSA